MESTESHPGGLHPAGRSGAVGTLLRRHTVRHGADRQRHPLYGYRRHERHDPVCGRPGGGPAAGAVRLCVHVHDRRGDRAEAVEVGGGLQPHLHRIAADAPGRGRRHHRQPGLAEDPRHPLSDRTGGDREDHLHPAAGQAAGVAAGGEAGSEVLLLRYDGGGPHPVADGVLRGHLRGYGQRPDLLLYLPVHGLCRRVCPAVVRPAVSRRRGGLCGGLGPGTDPQLHDGPLPGSLRPLL